MSVASIVLSLLRLIAEIAPGLLASATSSVTDEEAIEEMVERIGSLPERDGAGGADATDLDRRKRGG